MKNHLLLPFAFIISIPFVSESTESSLKFSAFEQEVWTIVMNEDEKTVEQVIETLLTFEEKAVEESQLSLLFMHFCRLGHLAKPVNLSYKKDIFKDIRKNLSASYYRCEQAKAKHAEQFRNAAEFSHLAFRSLDKNDSPALTIWIAYDYIQTALESGFYDEAIKAAKISLEIAENNNLTEWEGETLGRLALVQNALGNYDQALKNNKTALNTVKNTANKFELKANRGYILMTANRLIDAKNIYKELLSENKSVNQERYLISGINLTGIYLALGMKKENHELSTELMESAADYPNSYLLAYTKMAFANTLLSNGDKDKAEIIFSQARSWFENNQVIEPLIRFLNDWANLLHENGFHSEAYLTLLDSLKLNKSFDTSKRKENAMLNNALITAEQQKSELIELELKRRQQQEELIKKNLEQQLTLTILVALTLFGTIITYAYRSLRERNKLLFRNNKILNYESTHDPLTGAYNRRYFNEFALEKIKERSSALLLVFDIDHFKQVNDKYGHASGDEVLKAITKRIMSNLRETECIIRWGGEEFIIYIEKPDDDNKSIRIIERILSTVQSSKIKTENHEIFVTISIGFSVMEFSSLEHLEYKISKIDSFLYQAKQQGRNCAIGCLDSEREPIIVRAQQSPI